MASEIRTFRDLVAWQKGVTLCEQVYQLTRSFPPDERFGLTAQLRRAAVSIPSNIAEGYGRGRKQDYLRFLNIALGSLCEVETQLIIGVRVGLADGDAIGAAVDLVHEIERVLWGLIRAVQDSPERKSR